jgi:hypothetical protein
MNKNCVQKITQTHSIREPRNISSREVMLAERVKNIQGLQTAYHANSQPTKNIFT